MQTRAAKAVQTTRKAQELHLRRRIEGCRTTQALPSHVSGTQGSCEVLEAEANGPTDTEPFIPQGGVLQRAPAGARSEREAERFFESWLGPESNRGHPSNARLKTTAANYFTSFEARH